MAAVVRRRCALRRFGVPLQSSDPAMEEPRSSRPHMPGYGVLGPGEGTGLLPWQWAERRLSDSRNYWVITLWPDGRPHAMPVWGVWERSLFWFSSSVRSRKARNVAADPRCVITTEDPLNPVTVEGRGTITRDDDEIAAFLAAINAKYGTDYSPEFLDPKANATIRVEPQWAFGLAEEDFTGSPTRWNFDEEYDAHRT